MIIQAIQPNSRALTLARFQASAKIERQSIAALNRRSVTLYLIKRLGEPLGL
jgi:hypothetical protein